ncbi:hypothetical protein KR044_009300 [Drosophila immigrans]|nr:hypothetical protein KR044_009300 [Drosophila immigrans]
MYVCTICGSKKSELGCNPEYEFRRRLTPNEETHLEGMSDWCDKCAALRFFFTSDLNDDPEQELGEEQPTKKLASHVLAASAKRQQNERKAKGHQREASPNRELLRERDVLKQELLASLPAQLPRGCLWERQLRSASADRNVRRRQKINPLLVQRSKSLVNESRPPKAKFTAQVTNTLDEQTQDGQQDSHTPKSPAFNKDQLPTWQEEVQKQVNQLMALKVKAKPEDSILVPIERLTKAEMIARMQELQQDDLKSRLKAKRQQMTEWKRIRRHVDGEYDRVKEELDELKLQAELDSERKRRDRMKGGANLTPTQIEEEQEKSVRFAEKTIGDALDERIAVLLDTLQEHNLEKEVKEQTTQPPADQVKQLPQLNVLVSTVQRACFQGFASDLQQLLCSLKRAQPMSPRDPPLPQFETIPCRRQELAQLLQLKREQVQPQELRPLKISREPIYCPDSECSRIFFMSDFNEHLTHDHPTLAMERISPGQVKTFFMDTCATGLGKARCNMVYFVRQKFFDKRTTTFSDLVPILVMSARHRLTEFFVSNFVEDDKLSPSQSFGPINEVFLVWLTAVRPEDAQLMATISIWPASNEPKPEYLMVSTNEVYDIRRTQKPQNLYDSNRILMLSGNTVNRMTSGGSNFLAVQVLIH